MIASTPEALRRHKTAAVIVGGSTVVAALTAIGISAGSGGFDRLVKRRGPKVLRSGSILSIAPSSSSIPSLRPSLSTSPSERPSSTPTTTPRPSGTPSSTPSDAASLSTSVRPSVSMSPSSSTPTSTETENIPTSGFGGVPTSLEPTEYPNGSGEVPSEFPTAKFLQMTTDAPTTTNVPTTTPTISPNPTDESNKGTFRIRMHWQAGYMWQELPDEGWFCLACASCDLNNLFLGLKGCDIETHCEENMHLALTGCDPSKLGPSKLAEIATFKFLFDEAEDGLDGDQIQVHGTNLCVQQVLPGGTGSIVLRQCDASLKEQRFWGARPVGKAMELLPLSGNSAKCLTNHHHPRQAEQVYAEDCDLARLPDTSYWLLRRGHCLSYNEAYAHACDIEAQHGEANTDSNKSTHFKADKSPDGLSHLEADESPNFASHLEADESSNFASHLEADESSKFASDVSDDESSNADVTWSRIRSPRRSRTSCR
ncbi:hypothetical protein ACHAW5_009830 [Stephanodiscus triporus]|uniref:Ricin B lectin domain-containing protein n=1 Tax=Stephanodiscus triporus TaxID=2934178 RepID=A0ABD3NGL1_9STRA